MSNSVYIGLYAIQNGASSYTCKSEFVESDPVYHWSSERFSAAWKTKISVLVAEGRARVGVAAAATDWPKRIRDLQFLDHEGDPTTT